MNFKQCLLVLAAVCAFASDASADQTLESALNLTMQQAKQVKDIQAKYRRPFASKRGQYNTEMRKMRQAKLAKDEAKMNQQHEIAERLREELRQIRARENTEIRSVLTAEQNGKFDGVLAERRQMHGSARDERILEETEN